MHLERLYDVSVQIQRIYTRKGSSVTAHMTPRGGEVEPMRGEGTTNKWQRNSSNVLHSPPSVSPHPLRRVSIISEGLHGVSSVVGKLEAGYWGEHA